MLLKKKCVDAVALEDLMQPSATQTSVLRCDFVKRWVVIGQELLDDAGLTHRDLVLTYTMKCSV